MIKGQRLQMLHHLPWCAAVIGVPAQILAHQRVRIYVPHREGEETQEEQMLSSKTSQPANVTLNLPSDWDLQIPILPSGGQKHRQNACTKTSFPDLPENTSLRRSEKLFSLKTPLAEHLDEKEPLPQNVSHFQASGKETWRQNVHIVHEACMNY